MDNTSSLKPAKKVRSSGTVAQGNFLIRSHLTFGTIEAKIFTLLLAGIDKEDKELNKIEFPMSMVTHHKGGSAYDLIHEACLQLLSKKINAHPEDTKRRKGFHYYQVVIDCGLDLGKGIISGQFHPDVKTYLIDLKKNYTISELWASAACVLITSVSDTTKHLIISNLTVFKISAKSSFIKYLDTVTINLKSYKGLRFQPAIVKPKHL